MSPINLHDFFLATAGIRAGTLPELGERDNVERSGPAPFKLASLEVGIINSFRSRMWRCRTCTHKKSLITGVCEQEFPTAPFGKTEIWRCSSLSCGRNHQGAPGWLKTSWHQAKVGHLATTSATLFRFQLSVVAFNRLYIRLAWKKDHDLESSRRPSSITRHIQDCTLKPSIEEKNL